MKLLELSEGIWNHCARFNFGERDCWDAETFCKSWFGGSTEWSGRHPGWYWFLTDLPLEKMSQIEMPSGFPKNGIDFGVMAIANDKIFGPLLCQPDDNGMRVFYNGHQSNVMSRIRQHFQLTNDRTGAIGLSHYPLSKYRWEVRFFSAHHIPRLPHDFQDHATRLISESWGRGAIESAWRARFGWPILCKQ